MIKNRLLFISIICILLASINVFGQVKTVNVDEYNKLNELYENLHKYKYVQNVKTFKLRDGKFYLTYNFVKQFESNKRYKYSNYEYPEGKTVIKSEAIYYDDREFQKESDGEWKEIDKKRLGVPTIIGETVPKIEQYAIGKTVRNDQMLDVYSYYSVSKYQSQLTFNQRLTYATDEKIVEVESKTSRIFPHNVVSKTETTYSYDENLKINIPKIKRE